MSYVPGFQSFYRFLHIFVFNLAELAASSIRVKAHG